MQVESELFSWQLANQGLREMPAVNGTIEWSDESRKRGPCDPLLPHKLSDTATSSV